MACRSWAFAGFGFVGLAAASSLVPTALFGTLLVTTTTAILVVILLELRRLRRGWAGNREAALRVEAHAPLDQRLLTLVSAAPTAADTRIWSELQADNQSHLVAWQDADLGLRAWPAGPTLLAAAALAAVVLTLLPATPPGPPPPETPQIKAETDALAEPLLAQTGSAPTDESESGGTAPANTDADVLDANAGGSETDEESAFLSSVTGLQEGLGDTWKKSLAARAIGQNREGGQGEVPERFRGDLPRTDIGSQESQEGGALPPDNMAHLVEDDGEGQAVRPTDGEGGDPLGPGAEGGRPGESGATNPEIEGKGRPAPGGGGKEDPAATMALEGGAAPAAGGGPGAGDNPATRPALADAALDLSDRRGNARFKLALGASAGARAEGDEKAEELEARPLSRIAEVGGTEQAGEQQVRHDPIPSEYTTIIQQLFERKE